MRIVNTLASLAMLLGMNYGRPSDYKDVGGTPVLGIIIFAIMVIGYLIEDSGGNRRKK